MHAFESRKKETKKKIYMFILELLIAMRPHELSEGEELAGGGKGIDNGEGFVDSSGGAEVGVVRSER